MLETVPEEGAQEAAPGPSASELPLVAPLAAEGAPRAPWGVVSGVLTLGGRPYAWSFAIRNPYLPIEVGIDQDALRRWRIAVLRDLLRHKIADGSAARTARTWANVSWNKIARVLHPRVTHQGAPHTPRSYRTAVLFSYVALHAQGGTPEGIAGGPRRVASSLSRFPKRRWSRYVALVAKEIRDPATGGLAAMPKGMTIAAYQALFPNDPVPEIMEKRRRPGKIVAPRDYQGLWAESARRVACGRQGGRGKKKPRPAPLTQTPNRAETTAPRVG